MPVAGNIYLLKDLSRLSGHSVYTIKFYLKLGLIREAGRSPETRFRYFDDGTVASLSQIRAWRKEGRSLADIRQRLQAPGPRPPQEPQASGLEPRAVVS